jgi:mRNA (guanine-N7-)-methyltransferase
MINKYAQGKNLSVFDLCSGKGGDYFKWKMKDLVHYVGLDFSAASVKDHAERVKEGRTKYPHVLIVNDAGDDKNLLDRILSEHDKLKDIKQKIMFDIVSC